jgi:hypothetical protein
VLLALVAGVASLLVPAGSARAAPLPAAWCGQDETPRDRPDLVAGNQVHVVYAYPADAADRFGELSREIVRDLAGVDEWWRARDPYRAPRFDLAVFPGCDSELGALDISSVPLSEPGTGADGEPQVDVAGVVADDLIVNGLGDVTKKYLVYYDGPVVGDVCGVATSSATSGGPRRVAFVFLQSSAGCRVGGYGTGNGWPARTAAHELLHAFNESFAPGTAPNACEDQGHVCDSQADILSTGTSHPSPFLSGAVLDVGNDDYYDHAGAWWDLRDSPWLRRLEEPPGMLSVHVGGVGNGQVVVVGAAGLCSDVCSWRYDGGSAVRLSAVEHPGYRLLRWGGACSGSAASCELTVAGDETVVTATFGRAAVLRVKTRGPGAVEQVGTARCAIDCEWDLIPGSMVRLVADPDSDARFVGWQGLCAGARVVCTLAVALGAEHPVVTAVFRQARPERPRGEQREA